MRAIKLRCPKCGNCMLYAPKDSNLMTKRKACVYCGHSIAVRNCIISAD